MINIEVLEFANSMMLRNKVQLIRSLNVVNDSESEIVDAKLSIEGEDIEKCEVDLPNLMSGQFIDIDNIDLRIIESRVSCIKQPTEFDYVVTLYSGNSIIEYAQNCITIMPDDYWDFRLIPETIIEHIHPEDEAINTIISDSSSCLKRITDHDSFLAYQTGDPNDVRAQVASLFAAFSISGFELYDSSDECGQFIRHHSSIINDRKGTSLDFTLLFAAAIERMKLHPLLVFLKDKLLMGVWLTNETRPTGYNNEVSSLLNLSADGVNRMVLFNVSDTVRKIDFESSVSASENLIRESNLDYSDSCYIDVTVARFEAVKIENHVVSETSKISGVKSLETLDISQNTSQVLTRQDIWERKLLDFSLRNTLVNMRKSSVLPLVSFGVDKLEDRLQENNDISIYCCPIHPMPKPDSTGFFVSRQYASQAEDLVLSGISQNRLYAFCDETELNLKLKALYRSSRVSMEENGASTLFLNLGMLRWFESKTSVIARHAPLVLLPVDLIRKGGASGYVLRLRDEEPMFNITLIEYLKQNFNISLNSLLPLPKDDAGLDIKKIFTIIRHNISEQPRWDLIEEIGLGLFSFNKFVMWNDIHNHRDRIRDNEIIRSLLDGKNMLENPHHSISAKELDEKVNPIDVALPVDVDSSQLEAIVDAGNGRSFILYGPPGTGKSQTITNMIANALYRGKRVLFVAEKRAALEVVESRLEKIGLGPFCLELHSNKVSKQHILRQLQKATEVRHIKHLEDFEKEAEAIREQRMQMISYISKLHEIQQSGLTLYECISRYLSIEEEPITSDYSLSSIEDLKSTADKLAELDTVFKITGHPCDSSLRGLEPLNANPDTINVIQTTVKRLNEIVADITRCYELLDMSFGISIPAVLANSNATSDICALISEIPELSASLLSCCDNNAHFSDLQQFILAGKTRDELHEEILKTSSESVFDIDAHQTDLEVQAAEQKWFIPRFFTINAVVKKLRACKPTLRKDNLKPFIKQLSNYQKADKHIVSKQDSVRKLFSEQTYGRWSEMEVLVESVRKLCVALHSIEYDDNIVVFDTFSCASFSDWQLKKNKTQKDLLLFVSAIREFTTLISNLSNHSIHDLKDETKVTDIREMIDRWHTALPSLIDWCQYSIRKHELSSVGLKTIFEFINAKKISGTEASKSFLKGVYMKEASRIIAGDPSLSLFNGLLFNQQIEKYQEITNHFKELTKKETYCRLASKIPSLTIEAANNSEVGILKRNIANGGRGTSIRHLIDQIPTLLTKLCPCMLMSPLSVAQYLDIETQEFDLVIFDEASQMPTSEAIGSIARGKALVVVGDPKQMPPTSFFQVQQVDEEDADIDDLDSILDDCISLSLPEHYLSWHYRSRHESLISFSNHQYYDGRLMTFPSSDNMNSKVRFIHIDGTYDKGKTRCNRAEAEAIVEEVLKRLRAQVHANGDSGDTIGININLSDNREDQNKSIGVISFSQVQQNLIEDLLYEALDKDNVLKEIAFNCKEPIFIKNLENVQGDERDVILFSVGYGPDANGNVSMNFGPLNRQGGERRLNVAVSRARYEMVIYSTLEPEQIDLKRTQARGVYGLRKFLEFAKEGRMQLSASSQQSVSIPGFVHSVADVIRSMGYKVDEMVGSSHFKVDIAIYNPSKENEYLMGILCDSSTYYNTPTSRDRNMVQPQVLSGLGWNIMRIWSLDWYLHKQQVVDSIQEALVAAESGTSISKLSALMSSSVFNVDNEPLEEPTVEFCFEKKEIENVPLEDLKNALLISVEEQISIPVMDLKRAASKKLGYARMGSNVESALNNALGLLLSEGKLVKKEDDMILLP